MLTAGLRCEGQQNPKYDFTGYIPNDFKKWQPRLGLA
jgi:hypothetical protein